MAARIVQNVSLDADTRLLDYGCGTGLLSFELAACVGKITLADFSKGMLDVARQKVAASSNPAQFSVVELDLTRQDGPSEAFDLAVSMMAFHHIAPVDVVLTRLHRALVPGGKLVIADLAPDAQRKFHDANLGIHSGFEPEQFTELLAGANFTQVRWAEPVQIMRKGEPFELNISIATKAGLD